MIEMGVYATVLALYRRNYWTPRRDQALFNDRLSASTTWELPDIGIGGDRSWGLASKQSLAAV